MGDQRYYFIIIATIIFLFRNNQFQIIQNTLTREEVNNVSNVCEKNSSTRGFTLFDEEYCDFRPSNRSRIIKFKYHGQKNKISNKFLNRDVLSSELFSLWTNFHLLYIPQKFVSEKCVNDSNILLSAFKRKELWALKMMDSTAKIPSGLLNGNINQFGDFDQCLSIRSPVAGKYFLVSMDVNMEHIGFSKEVDSLVHSHRWIDSNLTDPGHRVPKASTIYWGICLPCSCSTSDLQKTLRNSLPIPQSTIIVDDKLSVTLQDEVNTHSTTGKKITFLIFSLLFSFIFLGTILNRDHILVKNQKKTMITLKSIIKEFSLRKNIKNLTNTTLKEEVRGIDGIRALNALALLLSHKQMALFYNPFINRTSMIEILAKPWAVIGRTAIIYTDSFLLLSGFLTTRAILKDLNETGTVNFKRKIITRVFRILPNLVFLILFCTYIMPDLGSGPLWGMVVGEHARLCKKHMWKNFLFIHNYMGFENMCLTHTHQLGMDMQLFFLAPFAVTLLWKFWKIGSAILVILATLSTFLRYWTTIVKEVSMFIYFGMPVRKFFDAANFSYILPTHRLTIYLMGVAVAFFMSQKRSHISLNRASLGWVIGLALGLIAMAGPWRMGLNEYQYNSTDAAIFNAFSPILWGLFISWTIWAANNSCAGWFGDFLCWKGFRIFSKIAYGVYLTQFPIFFYNVGVQRYSGYYKPQMMFEIPEVGFILMASTLLTLCVEMPFNNICQQLQGKRKMIKSNIKNNDNQTDSKRHSHSYIGSNFKKDKLKNYCDLTNKTCHICELCIHPIYSRQYDSF